MTTKSSAQSRRVQKPQRILVPVDFSDSSARALQHAAERAAESNGSLIIIYVVPADYGWLGIGRDESRDLDRSLQRQAADRLRAFANEHVGDKIAADLEVRIGQPAGQIIAAANESKCDAIVMSTRGITGLDRYLIGSVAIASPDWRHVPWFSCDPVNDRQNEDKNAPSFSASGTTLKRPLMSAEGLARIQAAVHTS